MFRPPSELVARPNAQRGYRPPTGAAYAFWHGLDSLLKRADMTKRTLTVVGHSMGAIVLDRVLNEFPDLPVTEIYYLAPAASMLEVVSAVVPFMARAEHRDTRFYLGTLHPFAEASEWQPAMLDIVPRGSLLEWIDHDLSSPETQLDRTAGKWSNLIEAQHVFPETVRARMVFKAFGVRDPRDAADPFLFSQVDHHGVFSEPQLRFWRPGVWTGKPAPPPPGAP